MYTSDISPVADAKVSKARKARRLKGKAKCTRCGCDVLEVLSKVTLCYECLQYVRGNPIMEKHHILGREQNKAIVDLPANLHRCVSERQREGQQLLTHSDPRDPLLFIVRLLQAVLDFVATVAEWIKQAISWLLRLREQLMNRFGQEYWGASGLGTLWG